MIRLPISLHAMTSGSPNYTVDPLFYSFLDSAVTWAEKLNINLILDNHTFDPAANTDPNIGPVLVKVWKQVAQHYASWSKYVLYEVLNEPHGIADNTWGTIQQTVIDAIREVDTKHTIVVGPGSWNTYSSLKNLPIYSDTNLIYTFHFYDPFLFTHQGANWTSPSMASLAEVPFPYNANKMPACPTNLKGTWVESSLNSSYKIDGTIDKVKSLIDSAIAFQKARNVKIYCGELGVYNRNSNDSDRVFWYNTVCDYLNQNNIPWTMWDYQGSFGLFKKNSSQMFDYDLNIPLLKALHLNVPEQKVYSLKPDSTGFAIYSDFIGENIFESSYAGTGLIDFYNSSSPNNGKYDISWNVGAQYTSIGFDFSPDKDFSKLVDNNYALSFFVRSNAKGTKFDVRFIETKSDTTRPWRMRYTVTDKDAAWDGYWHKLYLPLKTFTEYGAWDDPNWYTPLGLFDWKLVDRFEIAAEFAEAAGVHFCFDNIYIVNLDTAQINDTSRYIDQVNILNKYESLTATAYPNPMHENLRIYFHVDQPGQVEISIYNMQGQKIKTILNQFRTSGNYSANWNGSNDNASGTTKGIYFCKITSSMKTETVKIIKN